MVYEPNADNLGPQGFDFCPGCGYGSIVMSLAEALERTNESEPIFFLDIGCVDFMIGHLPGPTMLGTHGRTPALAAGYKYVEPDRLVVAIQGDGGFMSVGAGESLHSALRGDPITIVVLNNGVLADTGGQLSPSTPPSLLTTTSVQASTRKPLPFLEMLASLDGVAFAQRVAVDSVVGIRRVTRAIARAIEVQRQGEGIGIVEILSPCPTHWRLDPVASWEMIRSEMTRHYPLGVFKPFHGPDDLDE
jgi:2-oxoglutarate ferredoxin oxidoreductase subunit beta